MENTRNTRVVELLKSRKMTVDELAKLSGKHPSGLYRIVNNESEPTKSTLKAIANATGANYDWLLTGEGAMMDPNPKNPSPGATNPGNEPLTWQDATYQSMREQIDMLKQLVNHLSKGELNFHEPLDEPGAVIVAINDTAHLKASAA